MSNKTRSRDNQECDGCQRITHVSRFPGKKLCRMCIRISKKRKEKLSDDDKQYYNQLRLQYGLPQDQSLVPESGE